MARRKGTSTSDFGVGKRESHDSSAFYERFEASNLRSVKDFVPDPSFPSAIYCGDSTDMSAVPDDSVALVVTSPPYFAGKKYEIEFERDGQRYCYRLTDKGAKVSLLFVLFHQRVCGPLANSLFHHATDEKHRPKSKMEKVYHDADRAIQRVLQHLAA